MTETAIAKGIILKRNEAFIASLHRYIPGHDITAVWRMLTTPDALAHWLAPGSVCLQLNGRICLDFSQSGATIDSRIRELDPPHLLAYSWDDGNGPERPLRWELQTVGSGTMLRLSLEVPASEDIARSAAGWDAHLEMLLAALEGVPIRFPLDHFLDARQSYQASLTMLEEC